MKLLTITAIDKNSSDTRGRTFLAEDPESFKASVEEFEQELPFRKYELVTPELLENYDQAILDVLDEPEVSN